MRVSLESARDGLPADGSASGEVERCVCPIAGSDGEADCSRLFEDMVLVVRLCPGSSECDGECFKYCVVMCWVCDMNVTCRDSALGQ
jgi:hypothetical protein